MSWSNSATGTASQVLGTTGAWASYHAGVDEAQATPEPVKEAHVPQVAAAIAAIEKIVAGYPEGAVFNIAAHGSVQPDGFSGADMYVSYGVHIPTVE